jgi:hypothetical protein
MLAVVGVRLHGIFVDGQSHSVLVGHPDLDSGCCPQRAKYSIRWAWSFSLKKSRTLAKVAGVNFNIFSWTFGLLDRNSAAQPG